MTPVTNNHFLDFLQTAFINQHAANRSLFGNLCPGRAESDDIPRFCDNDSLANDACFVHDLRVTMQMPVCSVNRNEIARLNQRSDKLQFLFASMPAHMHRWLAALGVIDLGAASIKMVHHPADRALVPRNMTG